MFVAPVLLGDGVRIFERGRDRIDLRPLDASGEHILRFEVVRD